MDKERIFYFYLTLINLKQNVTSITLMILHCLILEIFWMDD